MENFNKTKEIIVLLSYQALLFILDIINFEKINLLINFNNYFLYIYNFNFKK
jgi:hypothetical protein